MSSEPNVSWALSHVEDQSVVQTVLICNLSREYRASRIEWCADECAQPFQSMSSAIHNLVPNVKTQRSVIPAHPSRKNLMGNRFQLLDLSDSDGSNGDDSSDDSF